MIQYQKNIALKLRRIGFKFDSSFKNDQIDYEVYKLHHLYVTIEHYPITKILIEFYSGEGSTTMFDKHFTLNHLKNLNDLKKLIELLYNL